MAPRFSLSSPTSPAWLRPRAQELLSIRQRLGRIDVRWRTLLKSVPLLLTGLSVAIAFRGLEHRRGLFLAGRSAFLGARYGMAALAASLIAGALGVDRRPCAAWLAPLRC
jgi:hypothetical protein